MNIVEFLKARYDEDEQVARAAASGSWWAVDAGEYGAEVYTTGEVVAASREGGGVGLEDAVHIARHNPDRVLREIEAHRSIVAFYEALNDHPMRSDAAFHWQRLAMKQTVRKLARIYADHPDFDPEWVPTPQT